MVKELSIERKILIEKYGKWLWVMRTMPEHAAHWLAGIVLPPHEIKWLKDFFAGYKENVVVASRGTSKSFSLASLSAPLYGVLHKNRNLLVVSASGFRGGKLLFKDAERLFLGELKSQKIEGDFLKASCPSNKILNKDPASWSMALKSNSTLMTIPTNNADNMRGIRANIAIVDERNTFDGEVVQKIIRPMMNVGQDFLKTATGSDTNQIFSVSTIDHTVRDWYPEIQAARSLAEKEYKAHRARKAGDFKEHDRLMREDDSELQNTSLNYSRYDYTDLLIPATIHGLDGSTYHVRYPLTKGVKIEDVCKYDKRDQCFYYFTYPVDKEGLEKPWRDGTMDEDLWLAEQRNVFISAAGNVYPYDLLIKVAEKPIYESGKIPGYPQMEDEFYAPVMLTCGDPCVLGVDVARETDESSIIVIRLGELASGKFDPTMATFDDKGRVLLGRTTWNHVCWAESWKNLPQPDLADKIRKMFERYNIVCSTTAGGVGMDKRGGGGDVRDHLGMPTPPVINGRADPTWRFEDVLKIYDPEDTKGFAHYAAFDSPEYFSGLRLLATTAMDNQEWTAQSKGMMQQGKLYLAKWFPPSQWAEEKGLISVGGAPDYSDSAVYEWLVGYNGVRRLKEQLSKLQRAVTEQGTIRFVMPTKDRTTEDGKKDLWAGMIYAVAMARQHLVDQTRDDDLPPDVPPMAVSVGDSFDRNADPWFRTLY